MTVDLTKITTPFGLLDEATQEALKAHGGPYEVWGPTVGWLESRLPSFSTSIVYRVKPAPPEPREWWIALDTMRAYRYWPGADYWSKATGSEIIHVREVLE